MNAQVKFPVPDHDRAYVGGGNVAGILGLSPYRTPLHEYLAILGEADPPTPDQLKFFARRKSLEPFAAQVFEQESGLRIVRANERYIDQAHPFIRAEIDFEVEGATGVENVETKSVHPLAVKDWGDADSDEFPSYVAAQCMHGLSVTNRAVCHVNALIGFDDARRYRVERDEEVIARIRGEEVAFWDRVLTRNAPPPVDSEDLRRMFARDSGRVLDADDETAARIAQIKELKAQAKAIENEIEAASELVKLTMRDASIVTYAGTTLLTWKAQIANRFDQKEFGQAHPALFEQFKRASEFRVFRVK